jgi:tetratricopeptide (TPR) repeat protein/predicted Ser/Thr protein kinase
VLGSLGTGGMGEVYRARDTRLRRDVAIKVLPDDLPADALDRLHREARAASALAHPNICAVFDLGEADGRSYLVMELVDGVTLREYAAGKPVDAADAIAIGVQIADALDAAHAKGIVHRDIKPGNVMVGSRRRVKVLDFGLAKQITADAMDQTRTIEPLTAAGTTIGTPAYMSPEALQGKPLDARSDLWSLGIVLYELLAGHRPFEGRTPFELTSRIVHDAAPPLPAEIPAALRSIVDRCLSKRPEDRHANAAQLRDALEALHTSTIPIAAGTPTARRSRALVVGAAALAIAVVVGAIMFLRPRTEPARKLTSTGAPASPIQEANDAFELAVQLQRIQNDMPRGMLMMERALAADPHFAEARRYHAFSPVIGLLNGYSNDSSILYKAEEELRQAAQEDPTLLSLPSAFTAVYLMQGRRELAPTSELDRVIETNPTNDSILWRTILFSLEENNAGVKTLSKRMLDREPLFAPARMFLGETLRTEGDYAGAIREQRKVLDQGPGNVSALHFLTLAYMDAGDLATADQLVESMRPSFAGNYSWQLTRGLLFAREGKRREALDVVDDETLKFAAVAFPQTASVAELYALLGDESKALEWFERAVRNGDERIGWFQRNPRLATIRDNPRFRTIISSIEARRQTRRPATP